MLAGIERKSMHGWDNATPNAVSDGIDGLKQINELADMERFVGQVVVFTAQGQIIKKETLFQLNSGLFAGRVEELPNPHYLLGVVNLYINRLVTVFDPNTDGRYYLGCMGFEEEPKHLPQALRLANSQEKLIIKSALKTGKVFFKALKQP